MDSVGAARGNPGESLLPQAHTALLSFLLAVPVMDFEDPLLTGLGISVDFLVALLLDELVSVVVQCSNEGIHCRRSRYGCDDGCPAGRDEYGIPQ